jgi:hypothetical protein
MKRLDCVDKDDLREQTGEAGERNIEQRSGPEHHETTASRHGFGAAQDEPSASGQMIRPGSAATKETADQRCLLIGKTSAPRAGRDTLSRETYSLDDHPEAA